MASKYDAVIVGAGPNGLAAGIVLAQAGLAVKLYEAHDDAGGGARSAELTLPGFIHDTCSAVHPLGYLSPFFSKLPLEQYGLSWIFPPAPLAHPLDGGVAMLLEKELTQMSAHLGPDAAAYKAIFGSWLPHIAELFSGLLGPFPFLPRHPFLLAAFGLKAIQPAKFLLRRTFKQEPVKALLAGIAAHSSLPLEAPATSAVALVLALAAHASGWPIAKGGSREISAALAAYFKMLGGELSTGAAVSNLRQLPPAKQYLFNTTPQALSEICQEMLPPWYKRRLARYRYGPGVFKMDFALSEPVPWLNQECKKSATVHLGGSLEEIAQSERLVHQGRHADKPFVIAAQPSLFDSSRAPPGKHTLWAYCHVPNGSQADMSEKIENQISRFAPGFRDTIAAKHVMNTSALEKYNRNYIGGDISGGSMDWRQLFARPVSLINPYRTPVPGIYLCSASTPPGAGVHGMCGFHAAYLAQKDLHRGRYFKQNQ